MNVTDLYWIGAGVLALIVIVLLVLWNVSQIQKQTGPRHVKTTEESKSMKAIATEAAEADSRPQTGEADMAASQRGFDTPPTESADSTDSTDSTDSLTVDSQPGEVFTFADSAPRPDMAREATFEQERHLAESVGTPGQPEEKFLIQSTGLAARSDEKIIKFPQSATSASMPQPQSAVGADDAAAVARLESSGLVNDVGEAARAGVASEFRHAEFVEQSAPLVLGREEMDIADEILDEDHVLRRAAYETLADRDNHAAGLPEALRQRLEDPRVLGWLTVHPDGYALASDQPYDESVIDMFATLAGNAARTAEVVGLTEIREFMVRGVEGMIAILPVSQVVADREGFLVIFLDEPVQKGVR